MMKRREERVRISTTLTTVAGVRVGKRVRRVRRVELWLEVRWDDDVVAVAVAAGDTIAARSTLGKEGEDFESLSRDVCGGNNGCRDEEDFESAGSSVMVEVDEEKDEVLS